MIAVGKGVSCAVVNGGAQCWGWNRYGQLGNGTTADSQVPVQVEGLTSGVTAVAAGMGHACAVVNGGVQCWGWNGYGQLGNGTTTDSRVPVQVQGLTSGVTAIAAGSMQDSGIVGHVCAVVNGSVQCWGCNNAGQLGNSTKIDSHVPVQVQGLTSGVTAIAVSDDHTCAVVNGGVRCWGWNSEGQLGDGTTTESQIPVQVQGLTSGVTAVSTGYGFTCAVVNGEAQCWGGNELYSTLGNSTVIKSPVPIQVQNLTSGVTAIAAGYIYSCAVVGGAAQCWGDTSKNQRGQMGNGTTTGSPVPIQVLGLTSGVTAIATDETHTCAVVNNGAQCWGDNSNGQLGNGSATDSTSPVRVQFP
jgi:alpha-tubulin suppressor-like RCC1 family protein